MAQRGIVLSYETVRQWCLKFGQMMIPTFFAGRVSPTIDII
jgi:transposase-like protein